MLDNWIREIEDDFTDLLKQGKLKEKTYRFIGQSKIYKTTPKTYNNSIPLVDSIVIDDTKDAVGIFLDDNDEINVVVKDFDKLLIDDYPIQYFNYETISEILSYIDWESVE